LRGAAVGLSSLLRNEGGGARRWRKPCRRGASKCHGLRLGESLDLLNPATQSFLEQAQARFLQQTRDPAAAQQPARLQNLRRQ
jgi:hypothetical protein